MISPTLHFAKLRKGETAPLILDAPSAIADALCGQIWPTRDRVLLLAQEQSTDRVSYQRSLPVLEVSRDFRELSSLSGISDVGSPNLRHVAAIGCVNGENN